MKPSLEYEYREWLINQIIITCEEFGSYRQLFEYLYSREFTYIIQKDVNRAHDGLDLRMTFAKERGYSYRYIHESLDFQCTVLEMIFALAKRCEDEIMADLDKGNRTGEWIYMMLSNMHLSAMTDDNFDIYVVERAIDKLLNRNYKKNGDGGLFVIKNCKEDLRTAELWYQMCWYLNQFMN